MKPSKWLDKFETLVRDAADSYQLVGDYLLVERMPEEEFIQKGGIFIPTNFVGRQHDSITQDRPHWCRVLAVGAGYFESSENPETGKNEDKTVPLDAAPGDIILVSNISVKYFSIFGSLQGYENGSIGLTRATDVQLRFKGKDGYTRAFEALNKQAAGQVESADGGTKT